MATPISQSTLTLNASIHGDWLKDLLKAGSRHAKPSQMKPCTTLKLMVSDTVIDLYVKFLQARSAHEIVLEPSIPPNRLVPCRSHFGGRIRKPGRRCEIRTTRKREANIGRKSLRGTSISLMEPASSRITPLLLCGLLQKMISALHNSSRILTGASGILETGMASQPLFPQRAFEPSHVEAMAQAFETVCTTLGLSKAHPLRDMVAFKIIDCAKRGEFDAEALYRMTLSEISSVGSTATTRRRPRVLRLVTRNLN